MNAAVRTPDGRYVLPGNRWDLLTGLEPDEPPMVAVIIAYFDAQAQLDRLLAALTVQTHPCERLEVIVADDGSPEPPRLDARGTSELDVRLVRQPDLGFRAGAARNLGARSARSDVLVFLDVDTVPEPDYLRRLIRLPALTPDALVTGRRRHADFTGWTVERTLEWLGQEGAGPSELTEPQWLIDEHRRTENLLRLNRLSYRSVISAVMACSRRFFEVLGGFDETLTQYGGEDWELAHRALSAGAVLAHVPGAVAWHDGPDWAERGDEESRRRQKAAETAALAVRIPAPDGRDQGWTGRPGIVAEFDLDRYLNLDFDGAQDEAGPDDAVAINGIRSLLASGLDVGLWLRGAKAESLRQQHFPADPRIRTGSVDPTARAGARIQLTLSRPLLLEPSAWTALLSRVEPGGVGEVGEVIVRAEGAELTVTSSGARARVARWSNVLPGRDLMEELFGRQSIDGAAVGVRP